MIKRFSIFLFLYCGTSISSIPAQPIDSIAEIRRVEVLISDAINEFPNLSEFAIGVVKGDVTNYYGFRRQGDSTVSRQNSRSVFEIGSISKVFTGCLLSDLAHSGKLALDQEASEILGFKLKDEQDFTLLQLATHTSGLPRIPPILAQASLTNPYQDFDKGALITYLTKDLKLLQAPGQTSAYSNLGVGLLGYILGVSQQQDYETLLQERIVQRLGLTRTTTDRTAISSHLVTGLNDAGGKVPNWDMAILSGAGGILSTTEDLVLFAKAHMDSTHIHWSLAKEPAFKVNDSYSMGLGWAIIKTESGDTWLWHNGGTGGYSSSLIIDVTQRQAVVVLSNISALGQLSAKVMALSNELMMIMKE